MKDLLFFSETFAIMNRFHYNKGKSFVKKIGRRMMKKIDAHLHLVRDLASYKGNGRSNALGNGLVVWDSGFKTRLFPVGWGEESFRVDAAEKVLADHDVAKAVLLQGSLYGFQNYYSWQAAKAAPDRFAPAFSVDPSARKRWAWPRKSWGPKGSYGAATRPGQPLSMITASFILGWKIRGFFQKRNWQIYTTATRKEFISRQTTWRL